MRKPVRTLNLSLDGNPIYFRPGTPDKDDLIDHLVREAYDIVGQDLRAPKLIIDCGAYAGYSTMFFLRKYPQAHVVAVEPDDENFELCRLNLRAYEPRVTLVHAAVWPEQAGLVLHRGESFDQREWATTVHLPKNGAAPDVSGVALDTLLNDSGFAEIDLLSMNINCSEEALFSRNYETWLPHVRNMIIQLHDRRSEDNFFAALSGYQYLLTRFPTILTLTNIASGSTKTIPTKPVDATPTITNGDLENLRVEPPQLVPGGWLPGSSDAALDWRVAVCDPPFQVSLAVRTGRQHSGENALLVRMNPESPVPAASSPYAAIENRTQLPVHEGELWDVRAFVRTSQNVEPVPGLVRGAYVFLRLVYDDGSTQDIRTEPLMEPTENYVETTQVLKISESPPGRVLTYATLWLYVWIVNADPVEIPAGYFGQWEVLFDDISCERA